PPLLLTSRGTSGRHDNPGVEHHPVRCDRPTRRRAPRCLGGFAAALQLLAELLAAALLRLGAGAALLDVQAEAGLEGVGLRARLARGEMGLDGLGDLRGEHPVEVLLQVLLRLSTRVDHLGHATSSPASSPFSVSARLVFSMRRPRWRRDMTVPIGTSRMSAASW